MISAVALANALYSASVLDLDTIACFFLAFHDTRLGPKNTTKPHMDLLSSGDPAQYTSEKPLTSKEDALLNLRPILTVYLTYLNILLTTAQ